MKILAGIDIGGTKCAVSIGKATNQTIEILTKKQFPTPESPHLALEMMLETLETLLVESNIASIDSIGISCGSPLDSKRGLILSPPNLPNWDHIDVITPFQKRFKVPVGLQNDANACALAEWKWGSGKGCHNMVFLTFGTGMGAGLILNGRLYSGTNDNAGEVGHVRLEDDGPIGYGKAGSFEGFCSGGGIAQLAQVKAKEHIANGESTLFCPSMDDIHSITTKKVGEAAQLGDKLAIEVFQTVAKKLGKGLAIIVDILNPERIVIGSIYGRQQSLLEPMTMQVLQQEALPQSLAVCKIVTAGLGEQVGDFASLSVALDKLESEEERS
ncbi:ROK family protein [Bacillus sp. FJAT-49711]|uniref:ROK family protein n=1 Tax=Bacillus sp. FJAT-49711 TaxID=2833585 RepID=UPI001BC9AA91|nr:ROK family protein [Bacillus sp. FJAT-49711]MBS4220900.1 ROK family protein [Bacillus sp. FJAT-49711]